MNLKSEQEIVSVLPTSSQMYKRKLIIIISLAVALRVGSALYMGDQVQVLPGIFDQISYDRLAQNLLAGNGFSFDQDWWPATRAGEPTAHWSYLMTLFLYGVYSLFGYHPLMARFIQAVIAGVLMPLVTFRLGERLGNRTVGLISAAISAIYIYFFYYAGALMTETFFILAVLGVLNTTIGLAQEQNWKNGIKLGIALGFGVLLRQTLLLFLPFLLLWLFWVNWGKVKWLIIIPILGIPAAMILPFTIRNYLVFDQFVLLNTNAGYVFFWANHPIHGTNFFSILPPDYPSYVDLIPQELLTMDEAALEKELMTRGLQFVLDDPGRYILLSINRLKDYFLFWPKEESGTLSNISRVGSFGIFLPFMIIGIVISLFPGKLKKLFPEKIINHSAYILIFLFIIVFSGIHLLSWAYVRYRLPVDSVLIIFAAIAIYTLSIRLKIFKPQLQY